MKRVKTMAEILLRASPLLLAALYLLVPDMAFAGGTPAGEIPPGTCTTDPTFAVPTGIQVVTQVVNNISCILFGTVGGYVCPSGVFNVATMLYTAFTGNLGFNQVLRAMLTIYVMFYGIAFMLGLVQITVYDFMQRAIKLGVIVALLSPASYTFFYSTVGIFFKEGTDALIAQVSQIAVGTVAGVNPLQPFAVIDNAIGLAISGKMLVTLYAMYFTGPYGLLFGILILMSLGTFVGALFQAVWVYLMSLVIKAFLFGLAPIFLSFLLFSKTRHLFDGWLNQLVNATLQPVFLFTFFAFYAKLIEAAIYNILRVPVCYMPGEGWFRGTPFDEVLPRFARWNPGTMSWEPYGGAWTFTGADYPGAPVFPISIMDVLIFLILAQLAWRFNSVVINIAKDISGASTSLNMSGAFSDMMSPQKALTNRGMSGAQAALKALQKRKNGGGGGPGTPGDKAEKALEDGRNWFPGPR